MEKWWDEEVEFAKNGRFRRAHACSQGYHHPSQTCGRGEITCTMGILESIIVEQQSGAALLANGSINIDTPSSGRKSVNLDTPAPSPPQKRPKKENKFEESVPAIVATTKDAAHQNDDGPQYKVEVMAKIDLGVGPTCEICGEPHAHCKQSPQHVKPAASASSSSAEETKTLTHRCLAIATRATLGAIGASLCRSRSAAVPVKNRNAQTRARELRATGAGLNFPAKLYAVHFSYSLSTKSVPTAIQTRSPSLTSTNSRFPNRQNRNLFFKMRANLHFGKEKMLQVCSSLH